MSKKVSAVWGVIQHSVGGSAASALPTPGLETHKHLALAANEVGMCVRIASIYAGYEVSRDDVILLLKEAGIAVSIGTGLAVVATKLGHGAINEILNFVPVVGWAFKGLLAGSLTASVGWTFIEFCEARYGA